MRAQRSHVIHSLWAALVITAQLSAGCLNPCDRFADNEWHQPGIWEQFPAEGQQGEIYVDRLTSIGKKHASWQKSQELQLSLTASENGTILIGAFSESDLTASEMEAVFSEFFAALGLPPPRPPDWNVKWYQSC